jgi:hypothetical protein
MAFVVPTKTEGLTVQLPHTTPSLTNPFGSTYDVTYVRPIEGGTEFHPRAGSGYLSNYPPYARHIGLEKDGTTNATYGAGGEWSDVLDRGITAQSRQRGLHVPIDPVPTGVTEMKDNYNLHAVWGPGQPAGPNALYSGARLGGGRGLTDIPFDADKDDGIGRAKRPGPGGYGMSIYDAPPAQRPRGGAWVPHTAEGALTGEPESTMYGQPRALMGAPPAWGATGSNPREMLASVSQQHAKRGLGSAGVRFLPEDKYNPVRMGPKAAERCRVSRRIENEGAASGSIMKSSYVAMGGYPETQSMRSRGIGAPAMVSPAGGADTIRDVQAHVIIDDQPLKAVEAAAAAITAMGSHNNRGTMLPAIQAASAEATALGRSNRTIGTNSSGHARMMRSFTASQQRAESPLDETGIAARVAAAEAGGFGHGVHPSALRVMMEKVKKAAGAAAEDRHAHKARAGPASQSATTFKASQTPMGATLSSLTGSTPKKSIIA